MASLLRTLGDIAAGGSMLHAYLARPAAQFKVGAGNCGAGAAGCCAGTACGGAKAEGNAGTAN